MNEIETVLAEFITHEVMKRPQYILKPDEKLFTNGLIDSLHAMDLALFVEDRFGVRIDDTELNKETFDTLAELAGLIQSRQ